jgi:hypothetical protein
VWGLELQKHFRADHMQMTEIEVGIEVGLLAGLAFGDEAA